MVLILNFNFITEIVFLQMSTAITTERLFDSPLKLGMTAPGEHPDENELNCDQELNEEALSENGI